MDGIVYSNLEEIAVNKEMIKPETTTDYWQSMEYETAEIKGKLLLAGELTNPKEELVLSTKLKGWYKIYIAFLDISFAGSRIYIRLSDDPAFYSVRTSRVKKPNQWASYEYIEEVCWRYADLSENDIIIKKPNLSEKFSTGIAWIRCVAMTQEEIEAYKHDRKETGYKQGHVHYDEDSNVDEQAETVEDTLVKFACLKDTDVKMCSVEFIASYDNIDTTMVTPVSVGDVAYAAGNKKVYSKKHEVHKARIELLHGYGIKAYAAYRMSIANFQTPSKCLMQLNFVRKHPEFYCRTREGNIVKVCSYAYREVQDYVIAAFKDALSYGFDGISLIYQRGIHIGFETPVLDAFHKRYPEIDAQRLPVTDKRLNGIWREIMTDFMKRLTKELDEFAGRHIPVNIITDYSPQTSYHYGLDIEEWSRLGIIDSICQDNMETFEELEGCMKEDDTIDMDKYKEKIAVRAIVRRRFGNNLEKTVEGAKSYLEIAKKYGVEFFGGMPGTTARLEEIIQFRNALRDVGVTNFSVFNFCHFAWDLPACHILSQMCHEEIRVEDWKPGFYRVFSLDESNIGTYNPNWRG